MARCHVHATGNQLLSSTSACHGVFKLQNYVFLNQLFVVSYLLLLTFNRLLRIFYLTIM